MVIRLTDEQHDTLAQMVPPLKGLQDCMRRCVEGLQLLVRRDEDGWYLDVPPADARQALRLATREKVVPEQLRAIGGDLALALAAEGGNATTGSLFGEAR
jgi:(2Fe-2S) ferredoxin